jgi:hypothetical protein
MFKTVDTGGWDCYRNRHSETMMVFNMNLKDLRAFIARYNSEKGIFRRIFGDHHAVRSLKKYIAIEYNPASDEHSIVSWNKFINFVWVNKRRQNFSETYSLLKTSIAYDFIKKWRSEFADRRAEQLQAELLQEQQRQQAVASELLAYENMTASMNSLRDTCSVSPAPPPVALPRAQEDYYSKMQSYRLDGSTPNSNRLFSPSAFRLQDETPHLPVTPVRIMSA